tara:strand:+ start:33 stop:1736 length:1704 start_codon:yes stop_codon:yes gene_type:complete
MKPTATTRLQWKQWLRSKRHLFNSNILECKIEDIKDVFVSRAGSVNDSDKVKILLTKSYGYIDIHNEELEDKLFYIPALPGDKISVGVSTDGTAHEFTFDGNDTSIIYSGSAYALNSTLTLSGQQFKVVGLGGGLIQGQGSGPPPTYTITPTSTTIPEGGNVTFNFTGTNLPYGTVLYYSLEGTATADDFVGGTLIGSFTVNNNQGAFGIWAAEDIVTDDGETFIAKVRLDSSSGTVVATSAEVTITEQTETYTVGQNSTSISEGGSVTYTVTTTNVTNGTTLYYTLSGTATADDFVGGTMAGSFTINNNTGSFNVNVVGDVITDDGETFTAKVRTDSTTGTVVATASEVTITDVGQTEAISQSATTINEGDLITFTLSTTGYGSGTTFWWDIVSTDGITAGDFFNGGGYNNQLSGYFEINSSGQASLTKQLVQDLTTEGVEKFKLNVRSGSSTGPIILTSSEIIVNDTSLSVGANANGKTFGPVNVNRDDGNSANASDWYTICDIDSIPDGSKVAMFIDTSGSMTMNTIQASYDLLVSKLNARGITIITVSNQNEDWITPFLTDLT